MFGIGSMEVLVILVVALLVLGPKNLPKVASTVGKAMGQFRRVSTEFQRSLNTEIAFEEEAEKKKARKAAAQKEAMADKEAGQSAGQQEQSGTSGASEQDGAESENKG